jgi:superfamily II DNA or RNA helicase
MGTKPDHALTLRDRLSRLTFVDACKLLGDSGAKLIQQGATLEIDPELITLTDCHLLVPMAGATVRISLTTGVRKRLHWHCSTCHNPCEHVGAAFSLILEDKTLMGLAEPPPDDKPMELLTDEELLARMLAERRKRATEEQMTLRTTTPRVLWSDYLVTNAESGESYRVALRGWDRGDSFCTCPDFRKNTLGTCKHILFALDKIRPRFPAKVRATPYQRTGISLHLHYGVELELRLLLPEKLAPTAVRLLAPLRDRPITDLHDLLARIRKLEAAGQSVTVYPDAEEYIQQALFRDGIREKIAEIRKNPATHPLRKSLLKVELLPYQMDGIAFAVGAGRAILADEMGLGKTVQGIGVAELLRREAGIRKVLVVCPASVKAQWCAEIRRFTDNTCHPVTGGVAERARQYHDATFLTVCNYEQVLRDILAIETVKWDLIILDEGQRIKNWEAKTSRIMKSLRSPFALVLSGTPLENRLDELYSVAEFIDDRRLGPAFRFLHRHRVVDERGKVLGYKNLDELRQRLSPVLLRRTRASVLGQLPPRATEVVHIPPTDEQLELHGAHMRIVSQVVRKSFLTEMDMLRLQRALLMCRMAADSTYLVTKEAPGYSSKLEKLAELLEGIAAEPDRKVIIFSEWTTMLDMIEPLLRQNNLDHVRLEGSVPQRKRQDLVQRFQKEPACRVFLATNAGATGLNLQAANTVINVDLPWYPALLEQRIGRAHRMGQKRPVQVFILVTDGTIEENLLATLSSKNEMALAALDTTSQLDAVTIRSGVEELKRKLEVLLGAKPEAPVDVSKQARQETQTREDEARRASVSAAGGQLLTSAFQFLAHLLPTPPDTAAEQALAGKLQQELSRCLEPDAQGQMRLTLTLPDPAILTNLAQAMARLAGYAPAGTTGA